MKPSEVQAPKFAPLPSEKGPILKKTKYFNSCEH